jgi:hypothetical protein
MRVQSQLLLIFICLNAGLTLVDGLGNLGVIPGYSLAHSLSNSTAISSSPTDAAVQYGNASQIATSWSQNPPTLLGTVGDILGSLPWYFTMIIDIFTGFPFLIVQLSSAFALDPLSSNVVLVISVALSSVWGWLMASFIVELISGRLLNEG